MRILLTGGSGMLGKSLIRNLINHDIAYNAPPRSELNLFDANSVLEYFKEYRPTHIIHAAALVGGISANIESPLEFMTSNLKLDMNVFEAASKISVPNLLYMSSSCIYPAGQDIPLKEEMVLRGKPEITNQGYALAKIIGMTQAEVIAQTKNLNWRSLILSNLYGPNDHFDPIRSHLLAAVILKIYSAISRGEEKVEMWGDGSARREFTFVDDVASFIVSNLSSIADFPQNMNLGIGIDYTVREIYEMAIKAFGKPLLIESNIEKPSGIARKLMDSSNSIQFGWEKPTTLDDGIKITIDWFMANKGDGVA